MDNPAFDRLLRLHSAGYRIAHAEGTECAFLEHPAGRKFGQWRVMVYDNGTIVGLGEMRVASSDDEAFGEFLRTVPKTPA
jgi:hypothetical protein